MEQYVKGFKGFTPVKMCGLSPLASFYLSRWHALATQSLNTSLQIQKCGGRDSVKTLGDTRVEAKAERLTHTLGDVEMDTRCKERGTPRYIA